jgi:hypothetical protein
LALLTLGELIMELRYRGISYQASEIDDQAENSTQVGLSRRSEQPSASLAKPKLRKPGEELVYRGVRYTR